MSNFYTIPVNFKLPGMFAEFNASKAQNSLTALPRKILLLGHKNDTGTADIDEAVLVSNGTQAELFGKNTMLTAMLDAVFAINPYQEIYALALTEPETGTVAKWQIDFTGAQLADTKTIALYVYGQRISISVSGTAEKIALQVKNALAKATKLPITNITATGAICEFSFIHKGLSFNEEKPHFNRSTHEQNPVGFTVNVTLAGAGAGTVDTINLAASLGDTWWSEIINPFSRDITLMDAIKTLLVSRDGGTIQKPGMQYVARKDIFSALVTFAETRNSRFETILGMRESATPEYMLAAIYAGHVAMETTNDPARALQYVKLMGVMPAKDKQSFTDTERNTLIGKGIATLSQNNAGTVMLERAVTSYKQNDAGADDDSYADLETFYILNLLRYQMNNRLLLRYPRAKIGNDADMLRASVVRPKDVKAEILALAQEWVNAGLINSIDEFREHINVVRSQYDSGRLEINLQPELIGQLRQIFVSIQFLR